MNPLELLRLDKYPDAPILLTDNGSFTRRQILERASAVAKSILEAGAKGAPVIVSMDAGPHFVAGLVGCWISGSTPVLLDPQVRTELDRATELSGSKVLLQGPNKSLEKEAIDLKIISVGGSTADIPWDINPVPETDPLIYLFTSGSTGGPTLVPKNFKQLHAEYRFLRGLFNEPMRVATLVPWCHIFGFIVSFLLPIRAGGVCDLSAGISPKIVLERAGAGLLDLVVAVPAFYRVMVRVLESSKVDLSKKGCRFATSGSAMSSSLRTKFETLSGCKLIDLYGSTEAGGVAFRRDGGDWLVQPHVEWRVCDEKYLEVRSPSVSTVSSGEFYKMGDLVKKTTHGFKLLGREDDVAKVGARRISLSEILKVLETSIEVNDAHVTVQKVLGEARIVAFVESASGKVTSASVKEHVRSKLADHKVPRVVHVLSALPRTPAGKIDRRALEATFLKLEEI